MRKPKAILWDLDGCLVKPEVLKEKGYCEEADWRIQNLPFREIVYDDARETLGELKALGIKNVVFTQATEGHVEFQQRKIEEVGKEFFELIFIVESPTDKSDKLQEIIEILETYGISSDNIVQVDNRVGPLISGKECGIITVRLRRIGDSYYDEEKSKFEPDYTISTAYEILSLFNSEGMY